MRTSERIYRILIRAYPASYLRAYAEPMVQLFRDRLRETGSGWGLLRLWIQTLTVKRPELSVLPCGLRMNVMARDESLRVNRYQSNPCAESRGSSSNAKAGLKNKTLGTVG